jgi:hypothetical protein
VSLAEATTVDLSPWADRFRGRATTPAVSPRRDFTWDRPRRFIADAAVAASEVAALAMVVGPFDDRLVSWPLLTAVFVALFSWRSR